MKKESFNMIIHKFFRPITSGQEMISLSLHFIFLPISVMKWIAFREVTKTSCLSLINFITEKSVCYVKNTTFPV